MNFKHVLIAVAALLLAGAVWLFWPRAHSALPRVVVTGGDGGGLPRATPLEEHLDAGLLQRAAAGAAADGSRALVVMRHGHIVFERYAGGAGADTVIDSGGFAKALVALAAGIAVQNDALSNRDVMLFDPAQLRGAIEAASHQSYADFLSRRLWSRLNAGPAYIQLPALGAAAPADCCFEARLLDWMRVAGVILNDGGFEGTDIVPKGWAARMRQASRVGGSHGFGVELGSDAQGARPIAATDVMFLRGPGHWRLWMMPGLALAVLYGADPAASAAAPAWDETQIPNAVLAALSDPPAPPVSSPTLQQLVPGH